LSWKRIGRNLRCFLIVVLAIIEKHLKLFETSKLRISKVIILVLAGTKTLAGEVGRFSIKGAIYLCYL
jgi:hypothetical protein